MKELIVYIAQSSICIGIFFLIYRVFLRSTTFFRFNRAFLLSGVIISFIIPTIRFSYEVVLPIPTTSITDGSSPQLTPNGLEVGIWGILSIIYLAGIIIQLLRNLTSYRKLIKLIKSGELTQNGEYKMIDSPLIKSPFTVLNCIAINTVNMTNIEKEVILKHEITHISQKHWIDLLCSECALLLQWFNPLMWLYVSSQKENHEFLADKAVIDGGISPAIYQATLINQRFQGPVFSFSNSFSYPNQLNRLSMIKKTKTSPWRRVAILALIPSFGLFFWASATPRYIFKSTAENENNQTTETIQDSVTVIRVEAQTGKPIQVIGYSTDNSTKNTDPDKALYIIDTKESTFAHMKSIAPIDIESVSVLKDQSATELYGEKGRNGVIIIKTKKGDTSSLERNEENKSSLTIRASTNGDKKGLSTIFSDNGENAKSTHIKAINPLIIVDGKVESNEYLKTIDPSKIERIEVFKDEKATSLYGENAKEGAILVTLKK